MKRKWAMIAIVLSLLFISVIVTTSFQSMESGLSPDGQRGRMYFVFAAYLGLLWAVRSLIRSNGNTQRSTGWGRCAKVAIGSIALTGVVFLCGTVLAVVIGGAEVVEGVLPKLLLAGPGIVIVCGLFLRKRMS